MKAFKVFIKTFKAPYRSEKINFIQILFQCKLTNLKKLNENINKTFLNGKKTLILELVTPKTYFTK